MVEVKIHEIGGGTMNRSTLSDCNIAPTISNFLAS
jgi:hypothetical protein